MDEKVLNRRDWLGRLIFKKISKPVQAGLMIFLASLLITILLGFGFDAWYPSTKPPEHRGILFDYPTWMFLLLLQPIIVGTYFWLQSSGFEMFSNLLDEGVFSDQEKAKMEIKTACSVIRNDKAPIFITLLSIVFTTIFGLTLTNTGISSPNNIWWTSNPIIVICFLPTSFITIYSVLMAIYEVHFYHSTVNKLFRTQDIHLEPIHPDKAGGLGAIGEYASNLGYIIGSIGIIFIISVLYDIQAFITFQDWGLWLYSFLWLLAVPLGIYIPIQSAHKAMVESKEKMLADVSCEFDLTFHRLEKNVAGNITENEKLLSRIKQLQEIRTLIQEFPTWPVNNNNMKKYFGLSFFSPLLSGLINHTMERFIDKIG
jgi:hypothetical protein